MRKEKKNGSEFLIELNNISRSYGIGDAKTSALNHFNLQIKRGEFIVIMGPSGCGKTTLLNILGLLDNPTAGTYLIDGVKVNKESSNRKAHLRSKKIGFVFQDFNLISNMTVIDNVAIPLIYAGKSKTACLQAAHEELSRFHLENREYYYPGQLSGGQKQRVAIARALVSNPEIILADEPTGNLDSRTSHIVMEELRKINNDGNTIIMVTHNALLTPYATRVIHMLDGDIEKDIKTVADEDLPSLDNIDQVEEPVKELPAEPEVKEQKIVEEKIPEKKLVEPKPTSQIKPVKKPTVVKTIKAVPSPLPRPRQKVSTFPIVGSKLHDTSVKITNKPTIEDLIKDEK